MPILSLQEISQAAEIIRSDGVIVYPTETVYGLGANAFSISAVRKVFEIKGRSEKQPVSIMVSSVPQALELCRTVNRQAVKLMQEFWPGPLTLVLQASEHLPEHLRTDDSTVGIRFPKHETCNKLVEMLGSPVTCTSANISGEPAAASVAGLSAALRSRVNFVLDGGICSGSPSTVVAVTRERPVILREGSITASLIWQRIRGI